MKITFLIAPLVLALGLMAGCSKEESKTPADSMGEAASAAMETTQSVVSSMGAEMSDMKDDAAAAMDDMKDDAAEAMDEAGDAMEDAASSVASAMSEETK